MEERLGDTAKDEKLLQEGRLHCVLWRVLPSPSPAGHGTAVKLAGAWRPRRAPHFVWSFRSCCGALCRKCRQHPKGTVARGAMRRPWLGSCRRKVGTTPVRRGYAEPNSLGGVLRQECLPGSSFIVPGKPHAESSRRGE